MVGATMLRVMWVLPEDVPNHFHFYAPPRTYCEMCWGEATWNLARGLCILS